jgi:CRP/FNR family transcriptional regulator, cyclic AMP receptor protein
MIVGTIRHGADRGVNRAELTEMLARCAIFEAISPPAAAALAGRLQPVTFPRRRTIFVEGQPGYDLYVLLSGKVKIRHRTTDGRESLIAVLGPNDVFGELALFDPGPRTSTVTTVTPVHAVTLDRQALRSTIVTHPEIAEQLLQVLARRLRRTNDNLRDLIFTDVPGRVARQLLDLATRFGASHQGAMCVDHNLSQKELAQLIGSSRETVNKALLDFAQRGWIRYQGTTVHIDEPGELARRAECEI